MLSSGLLDEATITITNSRGAETSNIIFTTRDNGGTNVRAERMRITKNGNVGIGTQTPTDELNVIGIANITGGVIPFTGAHVGELSETIENTSVL